jgi:hypothetical protein
VYVALGGFRRTWNFVKGEGGHVFESADGGETWSDISGNLPDATATDLLILGDELVVSTEAGVFAAEVANPSVWANFGSGLPNAVVNSLTLTPGGGTIVAATYGRGLWSIESP